ENEHVVMYYHEDTRIVHHKYQPTIKGEFIREQLTMGVELLKEHGANKWLSDNSLFNNLPEEDNQWIINDWFPEALQAGWKYYALVVPEDDMGKMNMVQFTSTFTSMDIAARVFVDADRAMEWLVAIGDAAEEPTADSLDE
ncbi:MAG: hypothetical protein AAF653_12065, partial [Chloroflexota bacterium]